MLRLARLYAQACTPVVIVGPTGTGKSHLAEYIHGCGPRRHAPLVRRTAAEFVDGLAPAQLLGNERGAYTGACDRTRGDLAEAGEGTLFLDDVHLLPRKMQALFLRVLDSRRFRPLRAARDLPLRCRVIVAMADCPDALQASGRLLPDFRYRLGRCVIRYPALRERPADIPLLASHFLRRAPSTTSVAGPQCFGPGVIAALERAPWPGNVRDLICAIEAAYLRAQGEDAIRLEHFDADVIAAEPRPTFKRHGDPATNRRAVEHALRQAGGSQTAAGEVLGVDRHTIRHYLAKTRHTPTN